MCTPCTFPLDPPCLHLLEGQIQNPLTGCKIFQPRVMGQDFLCMSCSPLLGSYTCISILSNHVSVVCKLVSRFYLIVQCVLLFVSQCSAYSGFGHGTQHTVLRTLYAVQPLPQFFTWSPLQQNYMVSLVYNC